VLAVVVGWGKSDEERATERAREALEADLKETEMLAPKRREFAASFDAELQKKGYSPKTVQLFSDFDLRARDADDVLTIDLLHCDAEHLAEMIVGVKARLNELRFVQVRCEMNGRQRDRQINGPF